MGDQDEFVERIRDARAALRAYHAPGAKPPDVLELRAVHGELLHALVEFGEQRPDSIQNAAAILATRGARNVEDAIAKTGDEVIASVDLAESDLGFALGILNPKPRTQANTEGE